MNPKHIVTPPSADLEKIRLQAEIAALNTTNTRLWVENTNLRTELAEVKQMHRAELAAIPDIRVQEAALVVVHNEHDQLDGTDRNELDKGWEGAVNTCAAAIERLLEQP